MNVYSSTKCFQNELFAKHLVSFSMDVHLVELQANVSCLIAL